MQHPLDHTYQGLTVQGEVNRALNSGEVQKRLEAILHVSTCAATAQRRRFWSVVAAQIKSHLN